MKDFLVKHLESLPDLDGRFTNIKCVNYELGKKQRGVLSLVFECNDNIRNQKSILKFYDPGRMTETYRMEAFDREPIILEPLLNKKRCLQLVEGMSVITVTIPTQGSSTVPLDFKYFVIECVENDIDDYFFDFTKFTLLDRLNLFKDIVLGTDALHSAGVHHRDMKPDNLRAHPPENNRQEVVVIDMGTAARLETENLKSSDYDQPVGAPAYAPPEAYCGLSGVRTIGRYSDYYALGCMLYELTNKHFFYEAIDHQKNVAPVLYLINQRLRKLGSIEQKMAEWSQHVHTFKHSIVIPDIGGKGSLVPRSVSNELQDVLEALVHLDYTERPKDLLWVRNRIDGVIKILEHKRWENQRRIEKEKRKKNKENKIRKHLNYLGIGNVTK